MNKRIDLNSDLGEGFGAHSFGYDDQIMNYITSANIACGFHAGDHNIMQKTVKMAKEKQVAAGAHPGLPDLQGFGRRKMKVSPEEVFNLVVYQTGSLKTFCEVNDFPLQHVKPHGALYNMAAVNTEISEAIASAIHEIDANLMLYGLAGSELIRAGDKYGLKTISEAFADRTYQSDGTLTPRSEPNAKIASTEKAMKQAVQMVIDGMVTAVNGTEIDIEADTICVHGDEPKAVDFVKSLKDRLTEEGVSVKNPGS